MLKVKIKKVRVHFILISLFNGVSLDVKFNTSISQANLPVKFCSFTNFKLYIVSRSTALTLILLSEIRYWQNSDPIDRFEKEREACFELRENEAIVRFSL